jgi:dihydroorotase
VISYCIEKFVEAGKLEHANGFLSKNGMARFGLKATTRIGFKRKPWVVPNTVERRFGDGKLLTCVVAMGGQERMYRAV